jgi:hypothetical protein
MSARQALARAFEEGRAAGLLDAAEHERWHSSEGAHQRSAGELAAAKQRNPYRHAGAAPQSPQHDPNDAARLEWFMRNVRGAELRRLGVVHSGGATRADVDVAMKSVERSDSPDSDRPLEERVLAAVKEAERAADMSAKAEKALATALREVVELLMPEGTVVDLRARPSPEWLRNFKTMKGNDRGTHVFRLVGRPRIEVNTTHITMSRWWRDAVPLSETTGKEMSGRTHGHDRGNCVSVTAYVCDPPDIDVEGGYHHFCTDHLMKLVARAGQ